MKYWNKQKRIRLRQWTKVDGKLLPAAEMSMKSWCQSTPGDKFFYDFARDVWYFERSQDASWFLLTWA